MVMVALPEPEPEQPPLVVIATDKPEEAVAATVNVLLYANEAGAAVVTLMVWLALVTGQLRVSDFAAKLPLLAASAWIVQVPTATLCTKPLLAFTVHTLGVVLL